MTADPEAVPRALAEAIEREYQAADPMDEGYRPEAWTLARVLASVLASLPDDRLAEAEADHNLLIEADSCLSYVRHRRASSLTDDDRREMDSLLSRLRPRTDAIIRERRAALSGGDAT